jgi:hypothetical protein
MLSSSDLPDVCYRDLFEDGLTPREAARYAVRYSQDLDTDGEGDEWFE